MKRLGFLAVGFASLALLAGCSSNGERVEKYREALDRAKLSLKQSVGVAESETDGSVAVKAKLLVDAEPVFSVGTLASSAAKDVRVDIVTGKVLSASVVGGSSSLCPGSVSLSEAIAVAEGEVGGAAVSIQPDDDGACALEVQVLSGDTLWEVKVGANGSVLETEEADDDEGDD